MTHDVNTHVHLGELEDIVARPGEDPQDLITCIKTLMDQCEMINDEHRKHELRRHIVCAYCHEGKLLGKLMAKPFKTPSSKLADIAVNHFAIQHTKSPTAPNLWTQSARTKGRQSILATAAMVTHHLHPPRTVPTAPSWQSKLPSMWFPLFQMWQNGTLGTQVPWWQATPTKECTSTWVTAEEVQMPT